MEWTPRLTWDEVPAPVRRDIEEQVGAPVQVVDPVTGGFSAGFAGVVRIRGRSVFVKATSSDINEHGRLLYRRERSVCEELARHGIEVGFAWGLDSGSWSALGFAGIDGQIYDSSWSDEQDLRAVLTACDAHRVLAPPGLPDLDVVLADLFGAWEALSADGSFSDWPTGDAAGIPVDPQGWCALAERARIAFAGEELLHADLRADNVLRTASGPVMVDWAYACRGHAAFDPIYLLLEVARARGRAPESALGDVIAATACDPDDATALLATFDGWFTWMSRQPPVPALPQLRSFQTEMAAAARSWVAARLRGATLDLTHGPRSPRLDASDPNLRGAPADV